MGRRHDSSRLGRLSAPGGLGRRRSAAAPPHGRRPRPLRRRILARDRRAHPRVLPRHLARRRTQAHPPRMLSEHGGTAAVPTTSSATTRTGPRIRRRTIGQKNPGIGMNLSHRERRLLGPDRRGDGGGRARSGASGAPGKSRGGVVSKSVAKAPRTGIGRGRKRGISTFLFRRSGSIRAFATDLDKRRRCGPRDGRHGSRRRPPGAPDAETCTSHSKVQFQPSFSSAKCTPRVQNAHLDEEGAGRPGGSREGRPDTAFRTPHSGDRVSCSTDRPLLTPSTFTPSTLTPSSLAASEPDPVPTRRPPI